MANTIINDEITNYFFPQYALPWNNYFNFVEAVVYSQRVRQRNVNFRLSLTPIIVKALPELSVQLSSTPNDLPNWILSLDDNLQTGKVIDSVGLKYFLLEKIIYNGNPGYLYEYSYNGRFISADLNKHTSHLWIILHLNLTNNQFAGTETIIVVKEEGEFYSSVTGYITVNGKLIPLVNPLPYDGAANTKIVDAVNTGFTNCLYAQVGKRLFLAVRIENTTNIQVKSQVTYQVSFRSHSTSANIGLPSNGSIGFNL